MIQPNGTYGYRLESTTEAEESASPAQGTAIIDNSIPLTLSFTTFPAVNFSPNADGVNDTVTFAASMNFVTGWTINIKNSSGIIVRTVTGNSSTINYTWDGKNASGVLQPDGVYTFQIIGSDGTTINRACTLDTTFVNFSVSQNVLQMSPAAGQTITYTSTVPFSLDETIVIRNEAGEIVRNLYSGNRTAGVHTDVWDGRNDSGIPLPDGVYFYSASVSNGTTTMVYTLPSLPLIGECHYVPVSSFDFDPYNNKPFTFTYNFTIPARLIFAFSPNYSTTPFQGIPSTCDPPNVCIAYNKYEESGPHTVSWAGVDSTGTFRPGMNGYSLCSSRDGHSSFAVILYGRKPVISGALVTVNPPYFSPGAGNQMVNFSFSTYQSQPATVKIEYLNQASHSVLRTITLTEQSPGTKSIPFDGKADNEMWVAPGGYVVTVTVTDAIGNKASAQILTTIAY